MHCTRCPIILGLTLRSRLLNKSVGFNRVKAAGLWEVLDWQWPKKKCWNLLFASVDFAISSGIPWLSLRLSELRPGSQLNNLKNSPVKITPPTVSLSMRDYLRPPGHMNGVQTKRLILNGSSEVLLNQFQETELVDRGHLLILEAKASRAITIKYSIFVCPSCTAQKSLPQQGCLISQERGGSPGIYSYSLHISFKDCL